MSTLEITTGARLLRAAFAVALTVVLGGCAGTPTRTSTGETFDDSWVTTQVKTKMLNDPGTSAMKISVETWRGTVTLTGFATASEAKRALEIAKGVPGVKSVNDKIIIRQ
jgi:osmotically-inducible protein OsmY